VNSLSSASSVLDKLAGRSSMVAALLVAAASTPPKSAVKNVLRCIDGSSWVAMISRALVKDGITSRSLPSGHQQGIPKS
jgi:hypothetical protein